MSEQSTERDLTKGSVYTQLWSLSWPMMLSMFFYTLYGIVDTFWVGKLSADAIAAVSISQITLFVMIALSMGIAIGSGVKMAMHIGAKEKDKAEKILGQSFVLAVLSAGFFTLLSLIFREQFLTLSGAVGEIFDPALTYFTITAGGSVLFFILMNIMFAFNSEGDTMTLAKLFIISTLVNSALDPLMIFGYGGFPALGIAGAAYATLISQAVFMVMGLWVLSRPSRSVRFAVRNLTFSWVSVKEVLRIGLPASLTQVINPVGTVVLIALVAKTFLEDGAAAYGLIFRLEFFAYLPAIGFGMAAMAMIGQNIGAGNHARATEIYQKALKLGFCSALFFGVLLMLFGKQIVALFTDNALVITYAQEYLWIVAGSYGFLAAGMIISSAFQAVGRSWPGFWLSLMKFFAVSVPLAVVLLYSFGPHIWLVWIAVAAGNVAIALVGYVWKQRSLRL
jgi:putative MATE family efflux protein